MKKRLWSDDEEDKAVVRFVLVMVLKEELKLLHPFMPFITEEIWDFLPHADAEKEGCRNEYLISAKWPEFSESRCFSEEEQIVNMAMEAITAIRNARAEAEAAPSRSLTAVIQADGEDLDRIRSGERYIRDLANLSDMTFINGGQEGPEDAVSKVIAGAQIFIPMADLVDFEEEYQRLSKEKKRLEGEVARAEKKLANQGFLAKAPESVVNEEKEKKVRYEEMLRNVSEQLQTVAAKIQK